MSLPPPDRLPEGGVRGRRRGRDATVGIAVVVAATAGLAAVALLIALLAPLAFPGAS